MTSSLAEWYSSANIFISRLRLANLLLRVIRLSTVTNGDSSTSGLTLDWLETSVLTAGADWSLSQTSVMFIVTGIVDISGLGGADNSGSADLGGADNSGSTSLGGVATLSGLAGDVSIAGWHLSAKDLV